MGKVKNEIQEAILSLRLSEHDILLLDDKRGRKTFERCANHFSEPSLRWWWEKFKHPSFLFKQVYQPYKLLNNIIPDINRNVWWIVEDDEESFYPVYDVRANIIKGVLDECFLFEYHVVIKIFNGLFVRNTITK